MRNSFLDYQRAANDPRLLLARGADAVTYTRRARSNPRVDAFLRSWEVAFAETTFRGVTEDGTREEGLFKPSPGESRDVTEAASRAAVHLLATATERERRSLQHSMNSRVWRGWMNPELYLMRYGVRLEDTSDAVRDATFALMRATLSDAGYHEARRIMKINGYLGDLVDATGVLNEHSYNVNLFGVPGDADWGWQIYGHHLALNCVFIGGQVAIGPVFRGSEPTHLPGEPAGSALFARAEQLALQLLGSLDPDQRALAVLYQHKRDPAMPAGRIAVGDELNIAGAFQDNRVIPREGIILGQLTDAQQELAVSVFEEMIAYEPESARRPRALRFRSELARTSFCWIGGDGPDDPFYFRMQGPTALVELDHHAGVFLGNEEPMRFHTHTVVRAPNGNDYGVALGAAEAGQWRDLTE